MGFARYLLVLNLVLVVLASKNISQNLQEDLAQKLSLKPCEGVESSANKVDSAKCKAIIAYLEKSCKNRGSQACTALGYLYENGLGVAKNTKRALLYYSRACDLRSGFGCVNAGAIYAEAKNYKEANGYFSRACELRNADGCFNAGVSHLYGQGAMESEFLAKIHFNDAIELYAERCERRDASACEMLANVYNDGIIAEVSAQKSQLFRQKACEIEARFCE